MHALYIIVQLRKLMEVGKLKAKYQSLNFHCSWALHARAKGAGADRILKRFDDAFEYWKDITSAPLEVVFGLSKTMALSSFKEDLRLFLSEMRLPDSVVAEEARWLKFLAVYSDIIRDCPFIEHRFHAHCPRIDNST